MRRLALCSFIGVLALTSACGSRSSHSAQVSDTFGRAAVQRGTVALECPAWAIVPEYIGGGGVIVNGCGMRQSYTCTTTVVAMRHEALCAPDGPPTGTHGPPTGTPPPDETPDSTADDHRIALTALEACQLPVGTQITVIIGVEGDVLQTSTGDEAASSCVDAQLRQATFARRGDAETVEVIVAPATTPTTPTPPVAPVAAPTSSSDEAAARAAIDALRDVLLACTSGAATAIVGDWSADGTLTLRLPDTRSGTPEDGCVRSSASGAHLATTPSAAGSVLHAIH